MSALQFEYMDKIEIKKARLSKGYQLEASYTDVDGNDITMKGRNRCHGDLRSAIAALVPFFADLTEQREADSIDWDDLSSEQNTELLRKIEVTGLSIGGNGVNRIVTITGRRTLMTSKTLNLNAPGVEMETDGMEWPHIDEFDMAVQGFLYEVREYIVNKKWEVSPGELDFSGDDPFAAPDATDSAASVEIPADVA